MDHEARIEVVKQVALDLRRKGRSYKSIARTLEVQVTTVRAWCDPAYAARRAARPKPAAKVERMGVCACGRPMAHTSRQCRRCWEKKRPRRANWTRREVLEALRAWAAEHNGAPPNAEEWQTASDERPTYLDVRKYFATWGEAIVAAGLRKQTHRFDRTKARAMRVQGVTDKEIAEKLGVTQSAIWQALGRRPERVQQKKLQNREEREAAIKRAIAREEEANAQLGGNE